MNKNEKELLDMIESKFKGKELIRFKELLVIDADTYLEEKMKAFSLKDVSHRRELLLFMEHLSTYNGIDEVIDCTKHQHIIEQYEK